MSDAPTESASRRRAPWWLPASIVCAIGFALSFMQPSCALHRDVRIEAMRSIVDMPRTYMGDPLPSILVARRLEAHPRAKIYDADLSVGAAFIYPPIAARLYQPLATLSPREQHQQLAVANHLLFCGILLIIARLVTRGREWRWTDVAIALGAAALFYPVLRAVELNQAMVLVTLLIGLSMAALQEGRHAFAGCIFAIAIALKPQLVLVLPLMWWHARRLVIPAIVMSVIVLALSLAYAGLDNHVDYATKVLPTLSRGYAYYANQSFGGLFNRLLTDTNIGVLALPPASVAARALTLLASLGLYAAAIVLVRRWRDVPGVELGIFAFAWLVATLISPIAWEHHYAPALFVFALLVRTLSDEPSMRTPRIVVTSASAFTLLASYFEVRALRGPLATLLASYAFVGALLLLAVLAWVIGEKARAFAAAPVDRPKSGQSRSHARSRAR